MAQQDTFFDRIKRLFSTNVIVRNIGGRKLKVIDTSQLQAGSRSLMDRYTRLYTTQTGYGGYMGYSGELAKAQRLAIFRDYEAMDDDAIISSALDSLVSRSSSMRSAASSGSISSINSANSP